MIRPLVAGLLLGVSTRYAYHLPPEWWWLARVGTPWLALAFAVGAWTRRARDGAICLVAAIAVYYAILGLVQHAYGNSPLGLTWLVVAVPGGALFGWLGAAWREGRHEVAIVALLSATFGAEALFFALFRSVDANAAPVLLASAAVAPALLLRGARTRGRAVALAGGLTVFALVAETALTRALGYLA